MRAFEISLLMLLLPLCAFTVVHKFYLSVTNVRYSEKSQALQLTTRIFIDDFETVLLERYDFEGQLDTPEEAANANDYIEKYLKAKFVLRIDGQVVAYDFIGKEYEDDVLICYIEIPNFSLSHHTSIEIQNELLTDLFDDQQNVVHFNLNGRKKSFVLIKENNKGMLNL